MTVSVRYSGERDAILIDNRQFSHPNSSLPSLGQFQLILKRGQVTTLIGCSGIGKSTLLRNIATASPLPPDITIGLAQQSGSDLLPWRSVRQNLKLPFELRGIPCDDQIVASLLDQLHLAAKSGSLACTLSVGESVRVALARSVVTSPTLLLLDEPTAALDPANRRDVLGPLVPIKQGRFVLLVTHDLDDVVEYADAVYVMRPGLSGTVAFSFPTAPGGDAMRHRLESELLSP